MCDELFVQFITTFLMFISCFICPLKCGKLDKFYSIFKIKDTKAF